MIVYSATRAEFTRDVFSNQIEQTILDALKHGVARSMIASWRNSMQYMNNVLLDGGIAEDQRLLHRRGPAGDASGHR